MTTIAGLPDRTPGLLGHVQSHAAGTRTGIALSPGGAPKTVATLDPNEDVVVALAEDEHFLLALADGHHGRDAADALIDGIVEGFAQGLPTAPISRHAWTLLIDAANHSAWQTVRALEYPRRASRSTLLVAIGGPTWLQWAAVGDSSMYHLSNTRVTPLTRAAAIYLGGPLEPEHINAALQQGDVHVSPGDWVVLASDGFADTCPHDQAIHTALADISDAQTAAHALADLAVQQGANDHVAVAVGRH